INYQILDLLKCLENLINHLRVPELWELRQYIRSLPTYTLMGIGAIAALVTYWYATRTKPPKPACDLSMQSIEVSGERARRSALLNSDDLLTRYYEDITTLYEVLKRGLRVSRNGPCLGSRKPNQPYEWMSYTEVSDKAEFLGSGLINQGCKATNDQFIGIFAQNRPEWVIVEQACYAYSMVVVPLYDTLGSEAISFILKQAEIAFVFCDTSIKAHSLLAGVERGQTPLLKVIIVMDPIGNDLQERGRNCGVKIVHFKEVELDLVLHLFQPPKPSDLAVVCFTSGTTGNPKGAMLTHGNIVSNLSAFLKVTEKVGVPTPADSLISFLPLGHMFERIAVVLCHGARIGFFQGDIRLLMDDLKALKPTVLPVVPRLLNRMFDKVHNQANGLIKRQVLEFAAWRKEAQLQNGIVCRDTIWDKLVFHKVQDNLGGRVKLMVTGAAPVSETVLTFLRAAIGCQFYEGYGQTECTAGCTMSIPGDWTAGHVGAPMPCNIIKLIDVEDMDYFAVKGEGEVCVKGPNVFKGYLKDPEKTAEALDADGWLRTGDIGKWLPNGTLKIIDRKKHIFKLAQGEYIAPEKIENVYVRSTPVAQVYVYGESLQACLVGIVVPDPETFSEWAQKTGVRGAYEELCKNQKVKQAVLEDMVALGKESGLKSFEQVKDIVLHPEMLTVQSGLLTPTFKAKRAELRKYFRSQLDELYANIKM
uniref:Long-chain-fatty-acid--CoA ligase n=1 Tax=Callorhinchus milii TaxID=7868 RepID=A0A4W3JAU3_CALMI